MLPYNVAVFEVFLPLKKPTGIERCLKMKAQEPLIILVDDSYHTNLIAEKLESLFGSRVVCYKGGIPNGVKIDIFILSGRDVLSDRPGSVEMLKKECGSSHAKVVAVSVMGDYLNRIIARPELGVDVCLSKSRLVTGLQPADNWKDESAEIIFGRLFTELECVVK